MYRIGEILAFKAESIGRKGFQASVFALLLSLRMSSGVLHKG